MANKFNLWNVSPTHPLSPKNNEDCQRANNSRLGSLLFNIALDGLAKKREEDGEVNAQGQAMVLGQTTVRRRAVVNWKKAARIVRNSSYSVDVWKDLVLETTPCVATEMIYDVSSGKWATKKVLIRINMDRAFAQGAMRRCFRLKMVPFLGRFTSANSSLPKTLDMCEWASLCKSSVLDVVPQIGRRTLMRIRTHLGLNACSTHHPTILTVGELGLCTQVQGCEHVENVFKEECHGMGLKSFSILRTLLQRAVKNARSWQRASLNRIAKQYMQDEKDILVTYEEDVIMQEVVKKVCEQYNSLSPQPPKAVDMLHVGLLRINTSTEEGGAPTYLGYESFVQGDYHKWNTNAGWVDEEHVRHTPHAFSFASFRLSKGELMVVDIQGVNDLYTDPQVHSLSRKGFGKGNLGAVGMALFLRTFRYDLNPVAQYLRLAPFALLDGELPMSRPAEVEKFNAGKVYLESREWEKRQETLQRGQVSNTPNLDESFHFNDGEEKEGDEVRDDSERYAAFLRRSSNERSSSFNSNSSSVSSSTESDDEDIYLTARRLVCSKPLPLHELNTVPNFLLECKATLLPLDLPRPVMHRIPNSETPEGSVHLAMVKLYEDGEDEDVLVLREGCSIADVVQFHLWMAALAGSLPAMERCALDDMLPNNNQSSVDKTRRVSRLNWLHTASLRGSRACSHRALDYIDPRDTLLCIFYLQRVLACEDERTEKERSADFVICNHEVHSRLCKAFLGIGEVDNARKHCELAAKHALEAGDYKAHMANEQALEDME